MPLTSERKKEILALFLGQVPILLEKRRIQMEKNSAYCHLCILDAMAGRLSSGLASNKERGKLIFTIFSIQTSKSLLVLILLCSVVHTSSTFFEPFPGSETSLGIRLMHCFCVTVYVVDVLLKMAYQGVEDYFDSEWQRLYAASAGLNVIDLIIHGGRTSWCNCLRPVAGLLRSREGRRFFEAVQKMVPIVIESLVPLSLFIIVVAIFCAMTFGDHLKEVSSSLEHHYNWFWLILTGDTLGKLLPENLFSNTFYQFFFFAMIYIGQKFLLSLILGATFDTFKSMTEKQLKKEKVKELQGLVKAFSSIDEHEQGVINLETWESLMNEMGYSPEESALYFELISGGSDQITVYQFLGLRNVLEYNFKFDHRSDGGGDHIARMITALIPAELDVVIPASLCSHIKKSMSSVNFERTQLTLCLVDVLFQLSGVHQLRLFSYETFHFMNLLNVVALLLTPSMLPVMTDYAKKAKMPFITFESLEFLLDINPFHIVYVLVVLKLLFDLLIGLFGYSSMTTLTIEAGAVVSIGHLAHALVQLVKRNGSLTELILKDVDTSDYVQMSVCFCVFIDCMVPMIGITWILEGALFNRFIWLIRGYSCLRIFGYRDTKKCIQNLKASLNGVTINVSQDVWNVVDKHFLNFKRFVDPMSIEAAGPLEEKVKKKDKEKDKKGGKGKEEKGGGEKEKKKKKKDKKKAFVPMDIPLRLRLSLVALDTLLLITDSHASPLLPLFPFSILTYCRLVSVLYILDTLVQLREKKGKLLDLFPSEITISSVWLCGNYYLYWASFLQLTGLSYIPGINIMVSSQVLLIARLVRTLRMIELNKELETFLKASTGVTFLFIQQMMFAFVSVYMFAMLGNLLFGAQCEAFADPLIATVTCQRLFLPADFIDVTEETMEKTSVFAIVFFIVYFFVSLVICNIALSIVIEWYADCLNDEGKSAAKIEELAQEKLIETIKTRARTRQIMRSIGHTKSGSKRKLNFEGLRVSRSVDNDHRAKLVGPLALSQKDLQDCQKYSPLDLVRGFREYQIAAQSQDEGAFVASFVDAGVGSVQTIDESQRLIEAGTAADKAYLLIKGQVRVELTNGSRHTLTPLCILGYEMLQPGATYNFSWYTDGPVEILMVEQKDILVDLDAELCGSLVRMAFKTKDMLASAIETDARNKAMRRRSLGLGTSLPASSSSSALSSLTRTPLLVAGDNSAILGMACKVMTNLGCSTLEAEHQMDQISSHLDKYKLSAALTELQKTQIDGTRMTICGKMTLCMPSGSKNHPNLTTEDLDGDFMNKKVLIVDDVTSCRKIASKFIGNVGFICDNAENGQVACDKLKENHSDYCAVLLDLRMPVLDGFATLRWIREELRSDVRVFLMTGEADTQETIDAAAKYNVSAILAKAVTMSSIVSAFIESGLISPPSP